MASLPERQGACPHFTIYEVTLGAKEEEGEVGLTTLFVGVIAQNRGTVIAGRILSNLRNYGQDDSLRC
jgi:hypothetical protein